MDKLYVVENPAARAAATQKNITYSCDKVEYAQAEW